MEIVYRLYGIIHQLAKKILRRSNLEGGRLHPKCIKTGCDDNESNELWHSFIDASLINNKKYAGFHYAGYIAESSEWCLPSWIWTNAAIVRMYCQEGLIDKAIVICELLTDFQHESGGWIVRFDYDKKGKIPMLAPNDSAYIANNAFMSLYEVTKDKQYLAIACKCADWIIETARDDGIVYTGFNTRDNKWEKKDVIVDVGFTAGLFTKLVQVTGEKRYSFFLEKFVSRYIELFYIPSRNGFCTSIGIQNQQQGGMFARGQAWALEGLMPAFQVLKSDYLKRTIEDTIETLLKQQLRNGGWPYNLSRKLMGEDCKAVSVIARDMMDWYAITKDVRILKSAKRALDWCRKHTAIEGVAKGGVFSYTTEGAIVKDLYTSCAFVYASAYAIELKKQIENAENHIN